MKVKTARYLRTLKTASAPGEDNLDKGGWWVTALLFKVSPPMEFETYETYRNGKLLHDKKMVPHRNKVALARGDLFTRIDPKYSHRTVHRTTAFVISSAADLRAMMERSTRKMVKTAENQLKVWQDMEPEPDDPIGVQLKAEQIARAQETIRLFTRPDRIGFEPETYLFPAHKNGVWKKGGELDGSMRGTLNNALPFVEVGYEVIGMPELPPRPYYEMEATL